MEMIRCSYIGGDQIMHLAIHGTVYSKMDIFI
jgi:hypothetical protein